MALKVLLTGATGLIGGSVLKALISKGHHVTALVRSEEKGQNLAANYGDRFAYKVLELKHGAWDSVQSLSSQSDAVIHTATLLSANGPADEFSAVRAFLEGGKIAHAYGKRHHFIYTSGVWAFGDTNGKEVDEDSPSGTVPPMVTWRPQLDQSILKASFQGIITSVIRPGSVYPDSLADLYIRQVKKTEKLLKGPAGFYGSFVHRADLADLYVLAMEKGAGGLINAVEKNPVAYDDVYSLLKEKFAIRTEEKTSDGFKHIADWGYFPIALCMNQKVLGKNAKAIGWEPKFDFLSYLRKEY